MAPSTMEVQNRDIIFKTFFDTSCPLILLDKNGFPLIWNNALDTFLERNNYKVKVSQDQNFWNMIKQLLLPEETSRLNSFISGKKKYWTIEIKYQPLNKAAVWFKIDAFLAENLENVFCTICDNSDWHVREMMLLSAKENAEHATTIKSQFLANMSHEIRTPIQTIVGTADLLSETVLDTEQQEYAHQIRFSADVLLALVNDVLDFSKIEAGQLILEEVPFILEDHIEKTADLIALEAHKKGLDLVLDLDLNLPYTIVGDPWRLNQIILNLIKNAVKFTIEGSVILRVFPIYRESSLFIEFQVIDSGIGVSKEHQDNLFTIFYQGDSSTTRKYGGTGLGLSISKSLVEMMHGDISCYRNDTVGSTFRFAIPAVDPTPPKQVRGLHKNPCLRILIVDDNKSARDLFEKKLAELGFQHICTVASGANALVAMRKAVCESKPFNAVFIDMIMPNMDGWRLSAEINKDKTINNALLYLVVPEGTLHREAKMKMLEWFNGYVYKPLKERQLIALVQNIDLKSFNLKVADADGYNSIRRPSLLASAQRVRSNGNKTVTRTPKSISDSINLDTTSLESSASIDFSSVIILIAEDHAVNRKLLRTMLTKSGVCTILEAENGREAVQQVSTGNPDLIFMDLQMPEMNGYEASMQIRKNGYTKTIIACTASAVQDETTRCRDCGMDDIIIKPFKRSNVIEMMEKWIQQ